MAAVREGDPYKRDRRRGEWRVRRELLLTDADAALAIQRDVVIVESRYEMMTDHVVFMGYGPAFEIVEPGFVTPEYRPVLERTAGACRLKSWEPVR